MVHRRRGIIGGTFGVGLVLTLLLPFTAQGADQFASPEFQQQWNRVESAIPNFWGPLETARNGPVEPYAEGVDNGEPGIRLVQYFDKAQMEKTNPDRPATNGLLTVELKTGNLQLGDFSFQPRNPARIGIVGDQDIPEAATYADLGELPERIASQLGGSVDLGFNASSRRFVAAQPADDPELRFVTYQGDPGGRFGQDIPQAFWDFMQRIPGGWLTTMGYPISEAFGTNVKINGQSTFVVVQAFERRVLTYAPRNGSAFRVEFGNIGRHSYRWRYERSQPVSPPPASGNFIGQTITTVTFVSTVTDVTWTKTIGPTKSASGAFAVVFVDVTKSENQQAVVTLDSFSIVDTHGHHLSPANADVQNAAKQQYNAKGVGDTVQPGTKVVFVFNAPAVVLIAPRPRHQDDADRVATEQSMQPHGWRVPGSGAGIDEKGGGVNSPPPLDARWSRFPCTGSIAAAKTRRERTGGLSAQ